MEKIFFIICPKVYSGILYYKKSVIANWNIVQYDCPLCEEVRNGSEGLHTYLYILLDETGPGLLQYRVEPTED